MRLAGEDGGPGQSCPHLAQGDGRHCPGDSEVRLSETEPSKMVEFEGQWQSIDHKQSAGSFSAGRNRKFTGASQQG